MLVFVIWIKIYLSYAYSNGASRHSGGTGAPNTGSRPMNFQLEGYYLSDCMLLSHHTTEVNNWHHKTFQLEAAHLHH